MNIGDLHRDHDLVSAPAGVVRVLLPNVKLGGAGTNFMRWNFDFDFDCSEARACS